MALFYFLPAAVAIVATGAGCYGVRRALSPYWPDAKSEKSAFFIAWFAASFVVSCKAPCYCEQFSADSLVSCLALPPLVAEPLRVAPSFVALPGAVATLILD